MAPKKQRTNTTPTTRVDHPQPVVVPNWLPDPSDSAELVDVNELAIRMLKHVQRGFGNNIVTTVPHELGKKGWAAPFHLAKGKLALKQVGAYQCAMNLLTLKVMESDAVANWRSVVYLADYYWHTTHAMSSGTPIPAEHFPHTIHVALNDPDDIEKEWGWEVFEKITGTEILLAFLYTVCCAMHRGNNLDKLKEVALTGQVKFHVVRGRINIITMRLQFTENLGADEKAVGFSSLREAEEIMGILAELQAVATAPVTNQEIRDTISIHRAKASEVLADVSAAEADANEARTAAPKDKDKDRGAQRMLDISIKLARVLAKHPQVLKKLRYMEQRWGKECLCDSPAKLEKIVQQCGGIDSGFLGKPWCSNA